MVTTKGFEYQRRTSPCEKACPAGNPIQKVHGLMKENRFEEALEYLRARNPFPGTTGRICTHRCENDCNRAQYDESVSIRGLERAAADFANMAKVRRPARMERSGKKIAVIGGGPAGLTFAYFTSLFGHGVTIFEAGPVLGGMPRLSIPDYRLPKSSLDMEIGLILEAGVKAATNTRIGRDISIKELQNSFDAVLIATGTWKERKLGVPGADKAVNGVEFLRQVNLGQMRTVGRRTIIVGGGGVAFDCAFTAKRLGAEEVHIVCLERSDSMCAPLDDIVQAEQEGIVTHNSCMVSDLLEKDRTVVRGIRFFEVAKFSFNAKGEAIILPATQEKQVLEGEMVIVAAGMRPDLDFLSDSGILLNPDGTIKVDPETRVTTVDGVFAAGDAVCGPSIVAQAIGQGRETAIAVNRFLTKTKTVNELIVIEEGSGLRIKDVSDYGPTHVVSFEEMLNVAYYEKSARSKTVTSISLSFSERDEGLSENEILQESGRCFHCGHCNKCGTCVEDCPGLILTMTEKVPEVTYPDECWHCGNCRISCPNAAISFDFPITMLV
jgi:NADPH-dependent glutamate synthase beta subunit-like oxidoreductase/NAD-dependent dihydropyrimidine dehydrogenase PreA subunit